ncbi:MAG: prolipoprotein diacylglyceryl transferase [Oscillospiraceae bacterium]|nr:prolipoprotein diacylglyceryl transferase [Oscillospiraceae bacterium]
MYPVTFPGLGLSFQLDRVAFTVFGKEIYWYGVIIALGFLLGTAYAIRRAKHFGVNPEHIMDVLLYAVPIGIICARAYYCIFYWDLFRDDPVSCLYIWEGGLAIYGGAIGGVLTVIVYCLCRKEKVGAFLDTMAPGLLIGQIIGRWGNFVNQEAYGRETENFLRMGLADAAGRYAYYHPTFLYESLWNLAGLIILHLWAKKRRWDGELFAMYVAWYGLGRAWIEGLRTDSLYLFSTGIRVSQLLAIASCIIALSLLAYHRLGRKHRPEDLLVNRVAAAKTAEAQAAEAQAAEAQSAAEVKQTETEQKDNETDRAEETAAVSEEQGEAQTAPETAGQEQGEETL